MQLIGEEFLRGSGNGMVVACMRTRIWEMALGWLWRRRERWMNLPRAMTTVAWRTMRKSVSRDTFCSSGSRSQSTGLAMASSSITVPFGRLAGRILVVLVVGGSAPARRACPRIVGLLVSS
jgi:hypothetical protein